MTTDADVAIVVVDKGVNFFFFRSSHNHCFDYSAAVTCSNLFDVCVVFVCVFLLLFLALRPSFVEKRTWD